MTFRPARKQARRASSFYLASAPALDEVYAAQEYRVRRRPTPIQPRLHIVNRNAEVGRQLVFAAEHEASLVQSADIDMGISGGGRAYVMHARMLPGNSPQDALGQTLIWYSQLNYFLGLKFF